MITYHELLKEGRQRMIQCGNSDQAAMLLLNELCMHQGINLYMEMDQPAQELIQTEYLEGIHRMERGEPLGYVLGYENFYGRDFRVNEDVLIPRPETEELVGQVLMIADELLEKKDRLTVFDVATGSGAIAVSLSLEEDGLDVFASDISEPALKVARRNNDLLGAKVQFFQGDMLKPFIREGLHCDLLVCNPPYIPANEQMEDSVVNYEPHVALFGGNDGLRFYRSVFEDARHVMNEQGVLAFEIGYDQAARLKDLAHLYFPNAQVEVAKDINGKDRMLLIRL